MKILLSMFYCRWECSEDSGCYLTALESAVAGKWYKGQFLGRPSPMMWPRNMNCQWQQLLEWKTHEGLVAFMLSHVLTGSAGDPAPSLHRAVCSRLRCDRDTADCVLTPRQLILTSGDPGRTCNFCQFCCEHKVAILRGKRRQRIVWPTPNFPPFRRVRAAALKKKKSQPPAVSLSQPSPHSSFFPQSYLL